MSSKQFSMKPRPTGHASPSNLMLGASLLMFASMAGQTSLIAQFNGAFRQEFDLSNGEFSLLYSGATLVSAAVIFFTGSLADRVSAKVLAAATLMLLAATSLFTPFIQNPIQLGVFLICVRFLGQGMLIQVAMTSMGRWFDKRRGRALSNAALGLTIGEAILPFSVAVAVASFGWRAVWPIIAVALAAVILPTILYLFRNAPRSNLDQAIGSSGESNSLGEHRSGREWPRRRVLRDSLFWVLIPGLLTMPCVGSLIIFHQGHLADLKDWSQLQFTAFLPVVAVASAFASLTGGALIDRYGAWRMISVYLLPLMLACVGLGYVQKLIWLPVVLALFGITLGLSGLLISALWLELYGTAHAGSIRSVSTSGMIVASAVGPGVAGVLIDRGISLEVQALAFAAWCLVWSIIYLSSRATLLRRIQSFR